MTTVTAVLIDGTDGQRHANIDCHVQQVDRLGCGCLRYRVTRPGPPGGPCPDAELLSGCGVHESGVIA